MTAATLTHALSDLRRLAGTLVAAEIARRAVVLAEAEKIAASVAAECARTRQALDAFREAQEAELAAVLAETAALATPSGEKDNKTQPKAAESAAPAPGPSGEKDRATSPAPIGAHPYRPAAETPTRLTLPVLPEMEQPAPDAVDRQWEHYVAQQQPEAIDLPDSTIALEQEHWANGWEPPAEPEGEPRERRAVVCSRGPLDGAGWTADEDAAVAPAPLLGVPAAAQPIAEAPPTTTNGKRPHRRKRGT